MKTIYIDVYFLINFTVDLLAIYFASCFSKVPTNIIRVLLASLVGGLYAVFGILFIDNKADMYIISVLILILMVFIVCGGGISLYRKIKYAIAFFLFQLIIGGIVYSAYCFLDNLFESEEYLPAGGENKKILILSVIVLLVIGILKLIIRIFGSTRAEKAVKLEVVYNKKNTVLEAFVDSGNLAVNPMDKTPVMLVNAKIGKKIFGNSLSEIQDPYNASYEIRKRITIIPVSFGGNKKILYGIRPDKINVIRDKKKEKVSLIIAIDNEGNDYGGYNALIPLSALDDVL